MTAADWKMGRENAELTQVVAARSLKVSQPYLSQLEKGLRLPSNKLTLKAAKLYHLPPTALPLSEVFVTQGASPDDLERKLAALGYPGFEHVQSKMVATNPAGVVLQAVVTPNLDTRLVEALPWVLSTYTNLNWHWLRDRAKLRNAQNRLGYLVHLASETATARSRTSNAVKVLTQWKEELEAARLAHEGTLCRDSMPQGERAWLRTNRTEAAAHWNLLTGLSANQLPYATH